MKEEINRKTVVSAEQLQKIVEQIESVAFGSVTVIIQNGKIVQIDKIEKVRML